MDSKLRYKIANVVVDVVGERVERVTQMPNFCPFAYDGERAAEFTIELRSESEEFDRSDVIYQLSHEGVDYSCFRVGSDEIAFDINGGEDGVLTVRHRLGSTLSVISGEGSQPMLIFALWLAYGVGVLSMGVLSLHSSSICYRDRAYLFLGESGTGKSTHTRLWLEAVEGAELLNDDSPFVRCEGSRVVVYGSPWSGKTHCYRDLSFELGGAVRLSQAPHNRIKRHNVLGAFTALYPSAPAVFAADKRLSAMVCDVVSTLIEGYGVWHLEALPDLDAARCSCGAISIL